MDFNPSMIGKKMDVSSYFEDKKENHDFKIECIN